MTDLKAEMVRLMYAFGDSYEVEENRGGPRALLDNGFEAGFRAALEVLGVPMGEVDVTNITPPKTGTYSVRLDGPVTLIVQGE